MSYILDALRRADAERERGAVPGLHTQQFGALPDNDEAPRQPRLLIGAVVLLAVALLGVLGWNWLGGEREKPPAPMQVLPPPVAVAAAPAPTMPASMAALTPYPPAIARPTGSSSAAINASPRPVVRPIPVPRRDAASASSPATNGVPPTTGAAATPAPAATANLTPPDRIVALSELPDALRRELPKLTYGGGSFSGDKASRLAFINGQVFHEGDTVAAGLVLTQVKQKGAVLSYKRWRFEIGT